MYCDRAEPRVNTANTLETTTCWSRPDLVDLAVHQLFQRLRRTVPSAAREPVRRTLSISAETPSNPRVAMEIFLNLHSRQKEREKPVGEDYARGIQTFKSLFVQYCHQKLADSLPELPQGSLTVETNETRATTSVSSQSPSPEIGQADRAEIRMGENEDTPTVMLPDELMTDDIFTMSGAATPAQDETDTGISQMEAADIVSELNSLLTIDDQSPSPFMAADPIVNPEPAATESTQNLADDQPAERRCQTDYVC